MALNPLYIVAPSLQNYFVNKLDGTPLAGGKIFTYISGTNDPKLTYTLAGNASNYTYTALPNPIILSGIGTVQDNNYNDVLIYWYPYDSDGNLQLYDIVVQDQFGNPQFTRQAWPNPAGIPSNVTTNTNINFIPNGQLLVHDNLINSGLLSTGSTPFAYGGFSVELPNSIASTNKLTFMAQQPVESIPQSPRYIATLSVIQGMTNDASKTIRIKFPDVNKFSTVAGTIYTFAFWAQSSVNVPISIFVNKYCGTGGTVVIPSLQQTVSSTTSGFFFNVSIDFGTNQGLTVDLAAENDYVSIDLSLPVSFSYNLSFTDFVLLAGNETITGFPIQTNADMVTRSVMGWTDLPALDGSDLYLPAILTPTGMTWDSSQIGTIGYSLFPIPSPDVTSPIAQHNMMPCDGASYLVNGYSANGIPYSRLATYLKQNDDLAYHPSYFLPLFGTGLDFVSALVDPNESPVKGCRITYNTAGAGSPLASDGNTGFAFSPMYIYNGVDTGAANYNITAYAAGTNQILVINTVNPALLAPSTGTSGFTITNLSTATSYIAFQDNGFYLNGVNAGLLANPSAPGKYFLFSNNAVSFYMWFKITNESDPAVGGRMGIQVNVPSTSTDQGVTDLVREALNAFQSTQIITGGMASPPPQSSYFLFSSNPASLKNYYAWFNKDGGGTDPNIAGRTGIELVWLTASNTYDDYTRDVIRGTLNSSVQYAAPDFRGMFFRSGDPNATWDLDAAVRFSMIAGTYGNNPGTFELQNFLSHTHGTYFVQAPPSGIATGVNYTQPKTAFTDLSGGTETRPVNATVYPFIRY